MTTAMKMNKKRLVIILVVALVIIGGAIAYGIWQIQMSNQAAEIAKKTKNVPQYKPAQRQELVDDVNKKYGSQDYAGAIKLIEGQQNLDDVNTQLLLAGAYANSGNLKKALEIYQKLYDADKLPDIALENMAAMAERAGEHQTAINAYKEAKEYAISSKTQNSDQIAVYDYKIAELEKKL